MPRTPPQAPPTPQTSTETASEAQPSTPVRGDGPTRRIACVHWSELPIAAHRRRLVRSHLLQAATTTETRGSVEGTELSEPRWSAVVAGAGAPSSASVPEDTSTGGSLDPASFGGLSRRGRGQRHMASVPVQQLSLAWGGVGAAPTAVVAPAAPAGRGEPPRALVRGEGGGARLVAIDGRARREGVREGMTVAEARACAPRLCVATYDPARLSLVEAEVTEALARLSPRQGRTGSLRPFSASALPDAGDFLLELVDEPRVTSSTPGNPRDNAALAALVAWAKGLELGPFTIGVSENPFAAICAAHAPLRDDRGRREGQGHDAGRVRVMRARGSAAVAELLAPLPSALLPASPLVAESLVALGLDRIGLVAALPLEGAQARFGEEGRRLVQLARGHAPPALATFVPSADPSVEVDLEALDPAGDGATTLDELVFALRTACFRLCPPLLARGFGVGELEVLLVPHGANARVPPIRLLVRPARAEIDAQALFELARATLEGARDVAVGVGIGAPAPAIARLRVTVTSRVPAQAPNESLPFARREATLLPLDVALARLRGRFGSERVVTPVRREDPRPEHRGRFLRAHAISQGQRPRLRASEEAPVMERAPHGPPRPSLVERLRTPPSAVGVVVLSRVPCIGDPWPLRDARDGVGREAAESPGGRSGAGVPGRVGPRRTVAEVSPPERVVGGWWSEAFEVTYHWLTCSDGTRALFARTPLPARSGSPAQGAAGEGLRLVAIAD